jgi:uncharacterized membrane protein
MDSRVRSWVKSITWRLIGIVVLGAISYAVTRDAKAMTTITLMFHGIRLIMYYWHERIWERLSWGRVRHPLGHLPMRPDLGHDDIQQIESLLKERGFVVRRPEYEI